MVDFFNCYSIEKYFFWIMIIGRLGKKIKNKIISLIFRNFYIVNNLMSKISAPH